MNFSNDLIKWYSLNKRDLPWRNTTDPYKIWLSEVILQQTRVSQGLPYYVKFIKEFPVICNLANASEDKVLKLWQGLGYYSRARNLQTTAKFICENHNGIFPDKYCDIISLKGVGSYTAAAISSFAFHENYAVLDGNVIRVLSRIYGLDSFFDTGKGKKEFQKLADLNLPKKNSHIYNQAIMEFGALVCTPKSPSCLSCVFTDNCFAFNNSLVQSLPKKSNKLKVRNRYIFFLIIKDKNSVFFKKKKSGIWSGLYEFPSIEFSHEISNNEFLESEDYKSFFNDAIHINQISPTIIHKLSHQKLYVKFLHISCDNFRNSELTTVNISDIVDLPVSKLIDNYLSENNI